MIIYDFKTTMKCDGCEASGNVESDVIELVKSKGYAIELIQEA